MAGFPENIVDAVAARLAVVVVGAEFEPMVVKRPLRFTDPGVSVGVYTLDWRPQEESALIGQMEYPLSTYRIRVQNLIKSPDEQYARQVHTTNAKIVRAILYRDEPLRLLLAELQEDLLGSRERSLRHGVLTQSFLNNELRGNWVHLATTDLWVQTETVEL